MQTFDYTYKRLGSKDRRGRVIKRCPKCGKRGAYEPPREIYDNRRQPTGKHTWPSYIHVEEFDGFFTFVREHCYIKPVPADAPADAEPHPPGRA